VRRLFVALLIVVVSGAPVAAADTGSIVGVVVDAETGKPVAGAVVRAVAPTGHYEAHTDARGQFTLVGVAVDTYNVTVDAPTYKTATFDGETVVTSEAIHLEAKLSKAIRTIGSTGVRAQRVTSAFQPNQPVDNYTVDANGIAQLQGKTFDTDQTQLLSRLPSVTVDRSGTPLIRGGYSFQTSLQYEGIDYTEPNASVLNRFENFGNANLLNGVGSLEIIPGGGDATHGDTGTGLIALTAKRGTYPYFGNLDLEDGFNTGFHQYGVEFGAATKSGNLSDYISFIDERNWLQYGNFGLQAGSIGANAITPDPFLNSNVNAHFGAPWTSAYFNTAAVFSKDLVDNLVFKFGKGQQQSLQFFTQQQSVTDQLNYGSIGGLCYVNPALEEPCIEGYDASEGQNGSIARIVGNLFAPPPGQMASPNYTSTVAALTPKFPGGGTPGAPLTSPDTAHSPFSAYKFEYQNILDGATVFNARVYQTRSDQSLNEAEQGLFTSDSGGLRTGTSADLTRSFGTRHLVQIGGKYEFAQPYGDTFDALDDNAAYTGANTPYAQIPNLAVANVIPDFVPVMQSTTVNGTTYAGTPGCYGYVASGGITNTTGPQCGYLAKYFPNGIPALPTEEQVPTATEQVYALYLQDTWSPSSKLRALFGMRLDGYNFLLPNDPTDPPAIDGIRHQRQYEPHLGVSYRVDDNDAVRVNFGRTLEIPLPTFLGVDVNRAEFNAFNGIPSYDNTKGPFDPLRPNATAATYCGPGTLQVVGGQDVIQGNQPCTSYGDQLYWLMRNYVYGLQGQIQYPLRGSTFTNYDASLSHLFKDGTALRVTPFYRRGYDIVESTRTLIGYDPLTEVQSLSPLIYSNFGVQYTTGVELDITHERPIGLSYQITGTYINQIGNNPPGSFLPTQSVLLGELYRSPSLSPLQGTAGVTERTRKGWRVNPDFHYIHGYPYGAGVDQAVTFDGLPMYIPLTDAIIPGAQGASAANAWVDPQNWGTAAHPNIAATRGTEATNSGPGTLWSKSQVQTDLTIEYRQPGTRLTYGFAIVNLFDQVADIPVVNMTRAELPVMTGVFTATHLSAPSTSAEYGIPIGVGSSYGPYILFPNQPPLTLRLYAQYQL